MSRRTHAINAKRTQLEASGRVQKYEHINRSRQALARTEDKTYEVGTTGDMMNATEAKGHTTVTGVMDNNPRRQTHNGRDVRAQISTSSTKEEQTYTAAGREQAGEKSTQLQQEMGSKHT
eukprot:GILK01007935.1.p1 GENE.GILK01007935.1~~GILK01007935.1.p1  ORF type:complete len:120 (+),score=16.02 GILK01007935.1:74-433(+)